MITRTTGVLAAIGSAVGASVRWSAVSLSPDGFDAVTIMMINGGGSLLLGLVLASKPTEKTKHGFGIGFCGGVTTFSTFAVEVATRIDDGERFAAATLLVGTVTFALFLSWAGHRLGSRGFGV